MPENPGLLKLAEIKKNTKPLTIANLIPKGTVKYIFHQSAVGIFAACYKLRIRISGN